jgi:hypothetical protein
MIGDLLLRLNKFLSSHKTAFFLSLAIIVSVLFAGILRLKVTESIFATLPDGKSFEEFNRLVESKNIINQIVFSIEIPAETATDEAKALADAFSDSLAAIPMATSEIFRPRDPMCRKMCMIMSIPTSHSSSIRNTMPTSMRN